MSTSIELGPKARVQDSHTKASGFGNQVSRPANILLIVMFTVISVACLYPLLLVISVSFTDEQTIIREGYNIFPKVFSTYSYRYLFEDAGKIFRGYGVSILVTVIGTLGSLILTSLLAYPISRKDMPLRNGIAFAVLVGTGGSTG